MTERAPTAQESALTALREAIVTRRLVPGQQIVQERLSTELGVSRVPLREALKVLEGEGQVVYSPHRGYFVADLSMADLVEAYRIRDLLETEAVAVAIPAMTEGDVEHFARLVHEWEQAAQADDLAAMATANRELHFALITRCELPRLIRMIRVLWDATDAYRSAYYLDPQGRSAVEHEHRAILDAVRARDPDAVARELRAHRDRAVRSLEAALLQDPSR